MRHPRRPSNPEVFNLALRAVVLGGALLFFCLCFPPDVPLCPFRFASGHPCPLCGMTHALCALGHGNWAQALQLHLLSPLVFALFAGGFSIAVVRLAGFDIPLPRIRQANAIQALLALLLGNWFLRMVVL